MDLSEYALVPVRADTEFILSRGTERNANGPAARSLLVLAPVPDYPPPGLVRRLEHEYSLSSELDGAWAVRPILLTRNDHRTTLVLEDPGGQPLNLVFPKPIDPGEFLQIAVGLCAAVRQLHSRGLVHKDIKPANILVNPDGGRVRLMGFGIASRLPRERQTPAPPEFIAGTLPYMAPEQTGRMNRSIDSRSDLYSLGVTLYELLTGSLPFTAADSMEWVHCHIAKQPVPPGERSMGVPAQLSHIVMKLLAKTAEDRYQTAAGLEHDLLRCSAEWEATGRIADFPLGRNDRPERLFIPEKLYGREHEVETLLGSFERVVKTGTPELVLVSGHPGIGKSSVVQELHKVLVPPRGLFASGKFDQYKRDIPYSTMAQAFQSLVRRLLTKSEAELAPWREALKEALGPNGQLLVDLVPELKLIIGEQPPVPELPPQDARRRFQLVFQRFIGVFARPEHPLALFLDDLQWLDSATLEALEALLTRTDVRHLLLIGAYRDTEVDDAHPLIRQLEAIRNEGTSIRDIRLAPLSQEAVSQLVEDALQVASDSIVPLATLIYRKTGGNPFFTTQFLSALESENLLVFDHGHARWSWDVARIDAKGYTENVVDLMIGKLRRLPAETQDALQQLACLGHVADFHTLSVILEVPEEEVHTALWEGVRQELLERLEGSYKFIHDRVHEAAYSLIPEALRNEAHLRIGRLLAAHTPAQNREEKIFDIVTHLNHGVGLITSPTEMEELAELNLLAGRKAKASTAYASALQYLITGAALLGEDGWQRRRDLLFPLELERAECEFLTGELTAADDRLTALSNRTINTLERAAVAFLHMGICTELVKSDRAVAVALEYLRHVGIAISPHPTEEEVRNEYEKIWSELGCRSIEEVADLPLMSDPESLAAVDILTQVMIPAVATDQNLDSLTTCRAVNLSLARGNCDASCLAYVMLARVALERFGDYKTAFRFGQVGFELVERRGLKRFRAGTHLFFATFVMPWIRHERTSVDLLRRAFDAANRVGDLTYAGYANCCLHAGLLIVGDTLGAVQREVELALALAEKARFSSHADYIRPQLALIQTLRGLTPAFGCFDTEQFDELSFEKHLSSNPYLRIHECWYWIRKLQARYFAGKYKEALEASTKAQQLLWIARGYIEKADFHFYSALSRAAFADSVTTEERVQHLEALAQHGRQLEIWAESCPDNFENRAALVRAEIARIENRDLDAMRLYEEAIQSSRRSGFVHNEAVAYERASAFYRSRGFDRFSDSYLRNARACYSSWGADGKVRELDRSSPDLKKELASPGPASTISVPAEGLDLATVIRVSQAVSSEMVLEKLFDTVMRKAMEHAGADRGLLVVPRGDELWIEAEAKTNGSDVAVRLSEVLASEASLPESIVRYVMRTHERLILDDASSAHPFSADPYFLCNHVRSLLCLPLLNQAKLSGVLYLENNLAPRVFTSERITVLEVLVVQAAISLENTRLYRDLQQRERESRMIVDNIPGLVGILSPSGEVENLNRRLLEYFGKPLEQLRDWRESNIIHSADLPRVIQLFGEAIASGQFLVYEARLRRFDGVYRWFQVRGVPARDETGSVARWYLLITDIEDLKGTESELRALKDQLYKENLVLREEVDRTSMFEEIVGSSRPLKAVLARVAKVAPTDSTVFITGETGTGKELLARAVHKRSRRSGGAFVSVNCAALAPSLISSELFGHEKGAFTGATQRHLGRFELADGGTIFLDEVGELLPDTQAALLRVLQEREFERVGGVQPIQVDVRVIAATNRDLNSAAASGAFRQDLYYRLSVFPIEVPPLRERREDVLLLVEYFVRRYASRSGKSFRSIDRKTLDLLTSYDWPGNIRELQNVIERSVILSPGDVFAVDELWLAKASAPAARPYRARPPASSTGEARTEREVIESALAQSRGRVSGPSGAAAKLGVPPSTLEHRIRALKIRKSDFKFR